MRLGAQMLADYQNVNSFEYANQHIISEGVAQTLYLQIVDLNKKICNDVDGVHYLRYVPQDASPTLQIVLHNIDTDLTYTRFATPVSTDKSIWSFQVLSTDKIGSANLHLQLTDGANTFKGVALDAIMVDPNSPGSISFC